MYIQTVLHSTLYIVYPIFSSNFSNIGNYYFLKNILCPIILHVAVFQFSSVFPYTFFLQCLKLFFIYFPFLHQDSSLSVNYCIQFHVCFFISQFSFYSFALFFFSLIFQELIQYLSGNIDCLMPQQRHANRAVIYQEMLNIQDLVINKCKLRFDKESYKTKQITGKCYSQTQTAYNDQNIDLHVFCKILMS